MNTNACLLLATACLLGACGQSRTSSDEVIDAVLRVAADDVLVDFDEPYEAQLSCEPADVVSHANGCRKVGDLYTTSGRRYRQRWVRCPVVPQDPDAWTVTSIAQDRWRVSVGSHAWEAIKESPPSSPHAAFTKTTATYRVFRRSPC